MGRRAKLLWRWRLGIQGVTALRGVHSYKCTNKSYKSELASRGRARLQLQHGRFTSPRLPGRSLFFSSSSRATLGHNPLQPPAESRAECVQAVKSNDAQGDGNRLLQADCSGDGRPAEDDGGEEPELNTVRLVVLNTVATEGISMVH